MIYDMRTYTCLPGTVPLQIKLWEEFGRAPQTKHLGQPVDAVFCRSPRTRARFGGKTFPLSHLGGRAKSASPKHDAWELAAVKDRGCPPILRALRHAPCAPQNRLPPRPLLAAAWPAAPPSCDCLTPASFKAHLSSR